MPEFSGSVIFCDDIREEIGGKVSYMGIYGDEMMISEPAPIMLPKFCIATRIRLPRTSPEARLKVVVLKDQDGETSELTSLEADMREIVELEVPPGGWPQAVFHINSVPFPVTANCRIKVRAYLDEKELKLGAIDIRFVPQPEE
jgi:hypothetical protein